MSWNLFEKLEQSVNHLGRMVANGTSEAYHASVEAAENALKTTTSIYEDVVKSGQTGIVNSIAGKQLEKFSGIIESVRILWPQIQADLGGELKVLEEAAKYRAAAHVNPMLDLSNYQPHSQAEIANAMIAIANHSPAMQSLLAETSILGMKSWGVEFAGQAGLILGIAGAYGVYSDLVNPSAVQTVLTPDLSIGLSAGADLGGALVFNTSTANSSDGSALSVTLEATDGPGGGVVFSFNLPDLSFSSIAILLKFGLDVNISGGVSYTFNV